MLDNKQEFLNKISKNGKIEEYRKGVYFVLNIVNKDFKKEKIELTLNKENKILYFGSSKITVEETLNFFKENELSDLKLDLTKIGKNRALELGLEPNIYNIECNFLTKTKSPINFFIDVNIPNHKITTKYEEIKIKAKDIKEKIELADSKYGLSNTHLYDIFNYLVFIEKATLANIEVN